MVGKKDPHCGWCGRPVDEFGMTCDEKCWDAFERTFGDQPKRDEFTSSTKSTTPWPKNRQPWYSPPVS